MLYFDLTRFLTLSLMMATMLAGCGFQPQYGVNTGAAQEKFSFVYIPTIPDKYGLMLRNKLTEVVGETKSSEALYTFKIDLTILRREVGFEKNLNTSRFEAVVEAKYQLLDKQNKMPTKRGVCRASEYYSASKLQIYQNISAEENAPRRGLEVVNTCLVDRLSMLLPRHESLPIQGN